MRNLGKIAGGLGMMFLACVSTQPASAAVITVQGDTTYVGNCIVFGCPGS